MSQKSIAEKLLIKENYRVLLVDEPTGYRSMVGELPSNVTVLTETSKPVDLVEVFVTSRRALEGRLKRLRLFLSPNGILWVAYPKGTSKIRTDINRDVIADYPGQLGSDQWP